MGCSVSIEDRAAMNKSRTIEKNLMEDKRQKDKDVKLLLLGNGKTAEECRFETSFSYFKNGWH